MNNKVYHITDADYEKIATAMADGTTGKYMLDFDLEGGAALSISGEFDYDSYQETDYVCGYGKGTGCWVNTNLFFIVSLADVYDENCDLLESDFDAERLKNGLSDALDII